MKKQLLCILLLAVCYMVQADQQVSVTVSNNLATIADPLVVKFIVKSNQAISKLRYQDKTKKYELLGEGEITTNKIESEFMVQKDITIAFFQAGNFEIGPFIVKTFDRQGNLIETTETNSIPLNIKSTLQDEKDILDLKNPKYLQGNPFYFFKYVIFALIVIALIIFIIIMVKRSRNKEEGKVKIILTPLQKFEREIETLKSKSLFEKDKKKEYSLELSSIIKKFLSHNYEVNAQDLTTTETMTFLERLEQLELLQNDFKFIFTNCDLIKFAKYDPQNNLHNEVNTRINEIINVYRKRVKLEAEKLGGEESE